MQLQNYLNHFAMVMILLGRSDTDNGKARFHIMKSLALVTDYGCPMKTFFIEIQNFWAWADKLGR
jgi:hypothetical protein